MAKHLVDPPKRKRSNCIACDLRRIMVCADVSDAELADLHTWIDDLHIEPGATLFSADCPANGVYCIRAGMVKLVRFANTGAQRIVRVVKRGDIVGMEAVFSSCFGHTAIAVGEVMACRFPTGKFRLMVEANAGLQRRLLEKSHQALREAETWLSELAGSTEQARERMARLLLRMREGDSNRIQRFSLEDIGAMLGITVETASRLLSELSRQGVLTKGQTGANRRFYSADIEALEQIATGRPPQPAEPDPPPCRTVRFGD